MPERNGGFVFKASGGALVVLASGLFDFDFATGALTRRLSSPLPEHVALHECACDRAGRFWVGSINRRVGEGGNFTPGGGKFFRLDGDRLTSVVEDITCANGLAFSPDGRRLYLTDSPTGRCEVWDLDPATGEASNRRTFFELSPGEGFVDGATVDAEGGYWATIVYGGALRRYTPDGKLDVEVRLPFENPTKVAFGGEGLDTLYVTTTAEALGDLKVSKLNGGVFAFKPGVAGCPEPLFAG
jgi:sugar lactone lactonase YvrE